MDNKTVLKIEKLTKRWNELRDKRERMATRMGGIDCKMQKIKEKIHVLNIHLLS